MKILYVSQRVPWPLKDGGVIAMHTLMHGLSHAGARVKVVCLNPNKDNVDLASLPPSFKADFAFERFDLDTVPTAMGAFKNLFTSHSYHVIRFYHKGFEALLEQVLTREKFDIIHLESLFVTPYLPVMRRHHKGPIAMRAHNVEHRIWHNLAINEGNALKKWYLHLLANRLRAYEETTLNKLDALVALTHEDADFFTSSGFTGKVHISPHGINLAEFEYTGQPQGEADVFHLGSMDWIPNQEAMRWFLDEIWPLVLESVPNVHFHLAGKKIPKWFYDRKDNNVTIAGEVPDARAFMQRHHIMVVPLLSGSGIRVKILEGMALGKPIIATPMAATGIEVTNGENILLASKPTDIAANIISLLKDTGRRTQLAQNARRLIETRYDNKVVSEELVKFYKEL
ncbi:MAG TPA: glycosyltransferase family 4 protein [Bacteroidia bacterium]|nr:glycosyltransferase family 4 protein [Bacteroidia bacterium]